MAITGILINHKSLTSDIRISGEYLPQKLQIENWEDGSLKSVIVENNNVYIGGKQGVFYSDDFGKNFIELKNGYTQDIYNKHTNKLIRFNDYIIAINKEGAFSYKNNIWKKIQIDSKKEFADIAVYKDTLYVMAYDRFFITQDLVNFEQKFITTDKKDAELSSLAMFMFMLHNGSLAGFEGKVFIDLISAFLALLIISGFYIWFFPKNFQLIKNEKIKKSYANSVKPFLKICHKYHNKLGISIGGFVLLISISGIFIASPVIFWSDTVDFKQFWNKENQEHFPTGELARFTFIEDKILIAKHKTGLFIGDADLENELKYIKLDYDFFFAYGNVFKGEGDKFVYYSFQNGVMSYDFKTEKSTLLQPSKEFIVYDYFDFNNEKVMARFRRGLVGIDSNTVPFEVPHTLKNSDFSLYQILFWLHKGKLFEPYLSMVGWWLFTLLGGIFMTFALLSGIFMWLYRKFHKPKHLRS